MKEIIKGLRFGISAGVMIFIFMSFSYYLNADFDTNLKANGNNSVLTQDTWNSLIDKLPIWENMPFDDNVYKFDASCIRRFQRENGTYDNWIIAVNAHDDGGRIQAPWVSGWVRIEYNEKNKVGRVPSSGTATKSNTLKLQRMCFGEK